MTVRDYNRHHLNEAMDDLELEAVVASSPWNVSYTSGMYIDVPLPSFLVTTRDGAQGLIINEADAIFMRHDSNIDDVRDYPFGDKTSEWAVDLLAELLKDLGLEHSKVGVEDNFIPFFQRSRLNGLLPKATFSDGTKVFNEARIYKTPAEIEIIRKAAYSTDKAIITGFALSRVGDTEKDLANAIQSCLLRYGAITFSHTVCSAGVQSTVIHAHPLEKPIFEGEIIHVDCGGRFEGYQTDLSRNAVVGEPNEKQLSIYRTLWEIEQLAFEKIKPGVVAREIFEIAEKEFDRAGLKYPWGTFGHCTGLLVHEGFEITKTSERVLESGMVLNIEPTHIEEGDARYHIEDTILVKEDGIEVLSSYYDPKEMYVIR